MVGWIIGRLIQSFVTFGVVVLAVFVLARVTGDPTSFLVPFDADPEQYEQVQRRLGLDKPVWEQFQIYVVDVAQGDLGTSFHSRKPVLDLVTDRVWPTLQLALAGLGLALILAVPLGIASALKRNSPVDQVVRSMAVLGMSVPNFVAAILLITVFSVKLSWLPAVGSGGLTHLVLPSLALAVFPLAGLVRLIRASLLESLDSSYVKFARLKGLTSAQILIRHALPNTYVPVMAFLGVNLASFVSGVVVVEAVFAWPGIGSLAFESLKRRDFPVLQAVMIFIGGAIVVLNLVLDLVNGLLDPRIRMRS